MSEDNSNNLHLVVYTSMASPSLSIADLDALVSQARNFNLQENITGVLVYVDEVFVQALEGERTCIQKLYEKICEDERHHSVTTLEDGALKTRRFSGWSMGFEYSIPDDGNSANSLSEHAKELEALFESNNGKQLVGLLQELDIAPNSNLWK